MKGFEYEITKHPAEDFKQVIYFCTETGQCSLDEVPGNQIEILAKMLNERGVQGWELIHISFGKEGVLVFWKRKIKDRTK